jgi:single-strand DNA-binding protein
MNVITLAGRAGRDPEMRYFESGSCVANLTLAVNSVKRDEPPDWFNLQIWGKTAQVAGDYVRKGSQIAVTGRMTTERWTDRTTGEEKSKPVVVVDRLTLLGSRQDAQQEQGYAPAPAHATVAAAAPAPAAAPAAAPPQQQHPAAGTVAAQRPPQQQQVAWNSAPLAPPDDDGIPF